MIMKFTVKWSWPVLEYFPSICLEELSKPTKSRIHLTSVPRMKPGTC